MRRVEDWSDCHDPAELRIRLDVALEENAEFRDELARVQDENGRLRARVGHAALAEPPVLPPDADPVPVATLLGVNGLPYVDA